MTPDDNDDDRPDSPTPAQLAESIDAVLDGIRVCLRTKAPAEGHTLRLWQAVLAPVSRQLTERWTAQPAPLTPPPARVAVPRAPARRPPATPAASPAPRDRRALGIRLRRGREQLGLSQTKVAEWVSAPGETQYSQVAVSGWERGHTIPPSVRPRLEALLDGLRDEPTPTARSRSVSRPPAHPSARPPSRPSEPSWRKHWRRVLATIEGDTVRLKDMAVLFRVATATLRQRIAEGRAVLPPDSRNPCLWGKARVEQWMETQTTLPPFALPPAAPPRAPWSAPESAPESAPAAPVVAEEGPELASEKPPGLATPTNDPVTNDPATTRALVERAFEEPLTP